MRERLKKDIKRKFGPVYWSKKLRDQRHELISDALDRYDEELQNGADSLRAYLAAFDSVGSTEALRASFGVDRRRRIFIFILLSVLSVLLATPVITFLVLASTMTVFGWIGLAIALPVLMLLLYCVWRLLNRDYHTKDWLILGTILSSIVTVLICIPIIIDLVTPIPDIAPLDTAYSYVNEIAEIESVSYIKMKYRSRNLTYTVLDTIDRDRWTDVLLDLGITSIYSRTYKPTEADGFLICFRDGHDPASVIYGEKTFFIVPRSGSDAEQYDCFMDSEEWKQMLRKYVNTTDD